MSRRRDAAPEFSIVIPTFDRPGPLAECLEAVAQLDYPSDRLEVIVVDDGGRTPVQPVIETFRERLGVRLLRQGQSGPAKARNTGVAAARGRFLAFIDDDCAPERDWLARLSVRLRRTPDRLLGGRTVNALPENVYSTACELILEAVYAYYNTPQDDARFFATNNMALGAELFRAVGGFDERFVTASEDREFCDRWRHHGYRMTYAPDAVVRHAHPHSLSSFCVRHFTFGRGAARYHLVRARRSSGRMRDEIGFHVNVIHWLVGPLRRAGARQALPVGGLLLLWQCFNTAGFVRESLRLAMSRSDTWRP